MAGTNTFINFSAVTATPVIAGTPGTAVPIDRVTDVRPDNTGTAEKFKGDANRFYAVIAVPTQERMMEIDTGDVALALTFVVGGVYNLAGKLGDAINGVAAGGGGIAFAQVNAVLTKRVVKSEHAKFGSATLTFESFAATNDGDPLTVTTL